MFGRRSSRRVFEGVLRQGKVSTFRLRARLALFAWGLASSISNRSGWTSTRAT